MIDNSQADDAWKSMEENPEATDASPEIDESTEPLNRHDGTASTDLGGDVSDLVSQV